MNASLAVPPDDHAYEDYKCIDVALVGGGEGKWLVTLEHGFMITVERGPGLPQPRVDSEVRVYGMLPRYARGVVIDGRISFYMTQAEWEAEEVVEQQKRVDVYRIEKGARDQILADMPQIYQDWIAHLRETQGEAAAADNEDGWFFVAMEADKVSVLITDEPSLETFATLSSAKRKCEVASYMVEDRVRADMGLDQTHALTAEQIRTIATAARESRLNLSTDHDEESMMYTLAAARCAICDEPESIVDIVPWPTNGLPPRGLPDA